MIDAAARWEQAADRGARGAYASAALLLDELMDAGGPWPSLAMSMRASHYRQIGAIDEALARDREALALACDAPSRADALIGLAADAVASADGAEAAACLVDARPYADTGWRTRTRFAWVCAEQALLDGRPDDAGRHAQRALEECLDRSPRHAAKSRIIMDASRGALGNATAVGGELLVALPVLRAGAWATLQWPAALVADDLIQSGRAAPGLVSQAARIRHEGAEAVRVVAEGLAPGDRHRWRASPAAARLLASGG